MERAFGAGDRVTREDTVGGFAPVFIVGAPRSGTTLLAVLLNRHSRIAIPPETQFFTEYCLSGQAGELMEGAREEQVASALAFSRIKDLDLTVEDVLNRFGRYDNDHNGLFRALLETYAEKQQKPRAGEKTPSHLEHVDKLLGFYPEAKVLCIVRDGRDVVRSLVKTTWAEPDNPRRHGLFCMEWSDYAKTAAHYVRSLAKDRFLLVRYEDILTDAENQLRSICSFLREDYEPQMLAVEAGSGVVPEWEAEWKQKAEETIDPSRAFAWRTQADIREIWWMNVMMGPELRIMGYGDTDIDRCPFGLRLQLYLGKTPYLTAMRPVSLLALRLARVVRRAVR